MTGITLRRRGRPIGPESHGRLRLALRAAALTVAAILLGVVGGRVAISHYGTGVVYLLVGIPLVIWLFSRPLVATAIVLAIVSVTAYGSIPRIPVPGHPPLNVADGLVLLIVGGSIWRRRRDGWTADARRFAAALVLLLGVAIFPTVRSLLQGHDVARTGILGFKDLAYLAIGLTIAIECAGRLWRGMLNVLIVVAVIASVVSILAVVSHGVASELARLDPQSVESAAVIGAGLRVRIPGLFFAYAMILPTIATALTVADRWRLLRALAVLPMLLAVALSLNRNMYFGSLAGLAVAVILGGSHLRQRALATLVATSVTVFVLLQSSVLPAATARVAARATSAVSGQVLQSNSLQDRRDEFAHALASIGTQPLLGVGWFQNYGSYAPNDGGIVQPRLGVENLYLHLATDLGIPTALAFLALAGLVVVRGCRREVRRSPDGVARGVAAAGVGAVVAMLISCLVGAYLQDIDSSLMFGLVCGLLLATAARAARASRVDV